jgi:hypothetical protein
LSTLTMASRDEPLALCDLLYVSLGLVLRSA